MNHSLFPACLSLFSGIVTYSSYSYYGEITLFCYIYWWLLSYTWLYLMQNRSKLPQIYIEFQKMIQTQFSRSIKIFRSDNAMEYRESSFLVTLKQNGTIPHHSCPSTFQQNGCAERKHRHIFLLLFQNRFEMKLFSLRFTQSIVFLRL